MTITANDLKTAQIGAIWQNKENGVIYFLRKTGTGGFEVWTSESSTNHYQVSINDAVIYANQHNLHNSNQTSSSVGSSVAPKTNKNNLSGAASDDSGQKTKKTAPAQPKGVSSTGSSSAEKTSNTSTTTKSVNGTNTNSSSWIPDGWPETYVENMTTVRPGRRLKNPLSYLSSYTYQISLYMITPDAYEAFVEGGRKNINEFVIAENNSTAIPKRDGGAFLVAQSGGVNTSSGEKRAPGFAYDYGIDNLKFTHAVNAKSNGTSIGNIDITFKVSEPYGFSFISRLKYANEQLMNYSNAKNKLSDNATKQFFILGIRFMGWDQAGRQAKGSDIYDGVPLDPNSSSEILFETFYDLAITGIKFKLDGKMTVYDITAHSISSSAINIRRGMNDIQLECSAETVHEALCGPEGLLSKINADRKKKSTSDVSIQYKIEWVGDASEIALATLRSPADTKKSSTPGSSATDTTQSNDSVAIKSQPKTNNKKIAFSSNTPIVQLIENVILQSSFIDEALKVRYTDEPQNDPASGNHAAAKPSVTKALTWYSISPKLSDIQWSKKDNDWAYTLTYVIQTYYVPVIDCPYVDKKHPYYGPHKRYTYWYTGLNSEIIGYSAQVNNLFFTIQLDDSTKTASDDKSKSEKEGIKATGIQPPQVEGGGGGLNMAAASSVRTSLYDPEAYVNANVDILGDPDFLMQPTSDSVNGLFNRHYGADGYTVNPTGGQVFFDIDFREGVDYLTNAVNSENMQGQGGTMATNGNISFWKDYPAEYTKPDAVTGKPLIQGLNYMLLTVISTLNNGSFTQRLVAYLNTFGEKSAEDADTVRENTKSDQTAPAPATDNTNASTPVNSPVQDSAPQAKPSVNTTGPVSTTPTKKTEHST